MIKQKSIWWRSVKTKICPAMDHITKHNQDTKNGVQIIVVSDFGELRGTVILQIVEGDTIMIPYWSYRVLDKEG